MSSDTGQAPLVADGPAARKTARRRGIAAAGAIVSGALVAYWRYAHPDLRSVQGYLCALAVLGVVVYVYEPVPSVGRLGRGVSRAMSMVPALLIVLMYATAVHLANPEPPCDSPADAVFGEAVLHGSVEIVLVDGWRGAVVVAAGTLGSVPLGEWAVIEGTATNVGARPVTVRFGEYRLWSCGRYYLPYGALTTRDRPLSPGLTTEFTTVFDIPADLGSDGPVFVGLGADPRGTRVLWHA